MVNCCSRIPRFFLTSIWLIGQWGNSRHNTGKDFKHPCALIFAPSCCSWELWDTHHMNELRPARGRKKHMTQLYVPQSANQPPDIWGIPSRTSRSLLPPQPMPSWPQVRECALMRPAEPCPVQRRVFQLGHYWYLGTDNSLFRGCSKQCGMFGSMPGLYPLDASSTATPVIKSKNIFRHGHICPRLE